jgi:hypothetical protein
VLGAGARDAPDRQRTLTATLEWSYRLLTPSERCAFDSLAVFAGGCTRDAAQSVTEAPLEVLEGLADNNLLLVQATNGDAGRLVLLETVREFALSRLARRAGARELRDRHCEHFLALAERTRPELRRTNSPALLARLDREVENFRAALRWAVERPAPLMALRLATALAPYWTLRCRYAESARWLEASLTLCGQAAPPGLRAAALERYAYDLVFENSGEPAEAAAQESLALRRTLDDTAGVAASLEALAYVAQQRNRREEAYRYASEAERLGREAGDAQTRTDATHTMAGVAPTLEQALALGEQAAAAHRAAGNRRKLAQLQSNLSYAALCHGDDAVARRLTEEAVRAAEQVEDPVLVAYAYGNAGVAALLTGDTERASAAFARELEYATQHGYTTPLHEALDGLATVAAARGQDELAATLLGAADAAGADGHDPALAQRLDTRFLSPARKRLGARRWRAAHAEGAELAPAVALRLVTAD